MAYYTSIKSSRGGHTVKSRVKAGNKKLYYNTIVMYVLHFLDNDYDGN